MTVNTVIDLRPALTLKQGLAEFDATLSQLNKGGVSANQVANQIEQLAHCLEFAIQHGLDPIAAQSRTQSLTLFAFDHGYTQEEVEVLLNDTSQLNGNA